MKKIRKKNKGFTLTELLVTIAVVTLVTTIAVVSIQQIIKLSEKNQKEASITGIKKSASQYTEEYKTSENDWFRYADNENEYEYACTTIGMLINKGYLKKDIIGLEIEEKIDGELKTITINENTSIKVERNKNTKVYNLEQIYEFNTIECGESADIDLNFAVKGNNTNCDSYATLDECPYKDWYNQDVTIEIIATNSGQISATNYTVNIDGSGEKSIEELGVNNEKTSDWNIVIGEQGRNIDACVTIIDRKDNSKKYCLSHDGLIYNMDKESPSSPILTFYPNGSGNDHKITSSGSKDEKGITADTDLDYYIDDSLLKEITISSEVETDVVVEMIESYVKDKAGNISPITTKRLTLKESETVSVENKNKYYCDFYPDVFYDTEIEAEQNCSKNTNIEPTENITYDCDLDDEEYTDEATAESSCYTTTNGTKTYSCDSGDSRSGTTCYHSYTSYNTVTVSGSCTDSYPCTNGQVESSQGSRICTDKGCPTGYEKLSWSCPGENHAIPTGSCTSAPSITFSCTNECGGYDTYTTTYTADCSCSIFGKSCSDCKKYNYGTVTSVYTYTCSLNNYESSSKDEVANNCIKTETGTLITETSYYCSLTNQNYETNEVATQNCTNYCSLNNKNDEICYLFEEVN